MLTTTEISEKINHVFIEDLKVKLEDVQPEKRISEDLGADSLQRVELVMKLEEVFDIKIPDAEAMGLVTIQDTVDYIQQRLSDNNQG